MPVIKCPNGKWRIGSGPCMYTSEAAAERAYKAYRAKEHSAKSSKGGILGGVKGKGNG